MRQLKEYGLKFEEGDIAWYPDRGACSVQEAVYKKRFGAGNNPDLCALPPVPDEKEFFGAMGDGIPGYDFKEFAGQPLSIRRSSVMLMKYVRAPMPLDMQVARVIDDALTDSYTGRSIRLKEGGVPGGPDAGDDVLSVKDRLTGRPHFFLIYGASGCGKTSSVNKVLARYPEAIHHVLDGAEYIQIPVLMVTATVGNMFSIQLAIARKIDDIVGGNRWTALIEKKNNVSRAMMYISQALRLYHVGCIILDESQYLRFDTGSSSVENLISLSEETGAALGFVANADLLPKISRYPRFMTRAAVSMTEAGVNTVLEKQFFRAAAEQMWRYQFTTAYTEMTSEIMEELEKDSLYNIAILKVLIILIQTEALRSRRKDGITAGFIHELSEKKLTRIRSILLYDDTGSAFPDELKKLYESASGGVNNKNAGRLYLEERKKEQEEWGDNRLDNILAALACYGIDRDVSRKIIARLKNKIPDLPKRDAACIIDLVRKDYGRNKSDTKAVVPRRAKAPDGHGEAAVQDAVSRGLKEAVNS